MRGWERVGRVWPDGFIRVDPGAHVDESDILVFVPPAGPMRCGEIRARHALDRWLGIDCGVTAIADGDVVYRATALGENAFKRGER